MVEKWDLYDENRIALNKTHIRGIPMEEGEYHIVTDIWTVNSNNKILITQRHPNKVYGMLWECTGGAALAGESSEESALRELEEEVGLRVEKEEIRLIHTVKVKDRFVDTYITVQDVNEKDLILQPDEVIDAKFISFDELVVMWQSGLVLPRMRFSLYRDIIEEFVKE